jgi:hypothetical protein
VFEHEKPSDERPESEPQLGFEPAPSDVYLEYRARRFKNNARGTIAVAASEPSNGQSDEAINQVPSAIEAIVFAGMNERASFSENELDVTQAEPLSVEWDENVEKFAWLAPPDF